LVRKGLFLLIVSFLPVFLPPALLAQDLLKTYKTQYTNISFADEIDLHTFTINIGTGLSFMSDNPEKNPLLVKNRVDKIVETVCSILDMHPLKLQFGITLYKTEADIAAAYRKTGRFSHSPVAFYSHGNRSIAVVSEKINDRVLAHEVAHAVLCIYFGAPPPARMQEVLAQYVDKHLWD
ncbi:MAG: hypothetical protein R6V76_11985, partial [Desulfobacterales bacterium]